MKKLFLLAIVTGSVLSSCKLEKVTATDDAYATPVEEKRLAKIKQAEEYKKQMEFAAQKEAQKAAEQERINKNPYYQDPSFSGDDYYDHQYASRVRRFHNNVDGAGYYDNYYTNSYYYNQNPAMWGQSIYSTYNWMPSNAFNPNFGVGFSNCWNCPNNGWGYNNWNNGWNNGWGYNNWNNGWNNGWGNNNWNNGWNNGWGYNNWNNGWNNGWGNNNWNNNWGNNNWNNGWGYYNSFDPNSSYQYGPRGAGVGGSNSPRNSFAGMQVPSEFDNVRNQFFNEIQKQQETTPRFTEISKRATSSNNIGNSNSTGSARSNNATNFQTNSSSNENPVINNSPRNGGVRNTNATQDNSNQSNNGGRWTNSSSNDNNNNSSGQGNIRSNSGTPSNTNSGNQNSGRSSNSIWNSGSSGSWNSGSSSEGRSTSGSSGSSGGGRSSGSGGGGRSGGSPR
jgi:hypothetical protein